MGKIVASVSKIEDVPKELQGIYVQKGDRWVLDVEKNGLRSLLKGELEEKDTRIGELETQNKALQGDIDRYAIEGSIRDLAAQAGVRQKALSSVVRAAKEEGWTRGENGKPVMMRDGKPVYGKVANQPKNIQEWMDDFLEENDFYIEDSGESREGNTGAGAPRFGKKPAEMTKAEKSDYISKNGLDAWEALLETA